MKRTVQFCLRIIFGVILLLLPAFAIAAELTERQLRALLFILGSENEDSVEIQTERLIALGTSIQLHSSITGSLYSFAWTQTGGPAAILSDSDSPHLTVQIPDLATPSDFAFALTVTGPDGEHLETTHAFTAYPNEAPALSIDFPCDGCRMNGTTLSFRGYADAGDDEDPILNVDVVRVSVQLDGSVTQVPVSEDGSWRLDQWPIPFNLSQITISAADTFGASTSEVINLQNTPTLDAPVFAIDSADGNIVYALETDWIDRLVSIDLSNGDLRTLYELRDDGLGQVSDMVALPGGGLIAFAEMSSGRIGTFSTSTGVISTLSASNIGAGQMMAAPILIDIDPNDDRLVAYDFMRQSIFVIDISTGDRTELLTGVNTQGIAIDGENDLVFYIDGSTVYSANLNDGSTAIIGGAPGPLNDVHAFRPTSNEIITGRFDDDVLYAISASSGNSTTLSSSGSGLRLTGIADVHYDQLSDRYLAIDFAAGNIPDGSSLVSIDPSTGNRVRVFSDRVGEGADIEGAGAITLGSNLNLYLAAQVTDNVVEVDLNTGDRVLISDDSTGFGPTLEVPTGALYSSATGLLILDADQDAVLAINTLTGDRAVLSSNGVGTGPSLVWPAAMTFNEDHSAVYVIDNGTNQILNVDLNTGNRTIVSDNTNSGPDLEETYGIALDTTNSRLIIGEQGSGSTLSLAIVAVDLNTGDRSRLSAHDIGAGPNILSLADLVVTGDGATAYVSSGQRVFHVDLATGNRSVLADTMTGNGDVIANLGALELDAHRNLLFGWNATYESILVIDLETGDRVIRSR